MERLQKAARFADGNAPTYLRTHPVTYERIAEAQSRAQTRPYRQVADSLDFHLVRALLRSYPGGRRGGRVVRDRARRAQVQQRGRGALRARRVAAARRQDPARRSSELATLERIAPPHPMIEAMAGHVLLDGGEPDKAAARFEAALARYPTKMQLVYDYPEALHRRAASAGAGRGVHRGAAAALPAGRPAAPDRREGLRGAGQAAEAAPAPRRVLRVAGQPAARDRPARARAQGRRRELLRELGRRDAAARAQARAGRAAARKASAAHRLEAGVSPPSTNNHDNARRCLPPPDPPRPRGAAARRARRARARRGRGLGRVDVVREEQRRARVPAREGRARHDRRRSSRRPAR